MDDPCAIGRLPDGRWIGFERSDGWYRLRLGVDDRSRTAEADADLLLALAIAYFDDALDEPPPELEATQADLSELVRTLARAERDPARRRLLDEVVDAIDDGLAVDVVINRLTAARSGTSEEQTDAVDLLLHRAGRL
jgi:hypothetical protein